MTLIRTFAEFLDEHGLPDAPELTDVERMDVAWAQYDQEVWLWVRRVKEDPDRDVSYSDVLAVLSEEIIGSHLGPEWFAEHVDGSATSRTARKYLRLEGTPAYKLLSVHRIHELARRLYQLQSFPWFDLVLRNVRTRDLSGAGFELDVIWLLHVLMGIVTPRAEISKKTEDYDITVQVRGMTIPIEAKAKDDETAFDPKTVVGTLKGAASQLPKGQKGLVFLRVPPAWVGPELEASYNGAIAEGIRQTSRVGAVISAIDKLHLNDDRTAGRVKRVYDFYRDPACPDDLWDYCLRLKRTLEDNMTVLAPRPPF